MESTRLSQWLAAILAALILPASAATFLPVTRAPIALDAASSEYDRSRNQLLFRQVRITQGDLSIAADQAVANNLDFAASTWEFTGHVELEGQGARITANEASIRFSNHQLVQATATGGPATFERDATPEMRALTGDAEVIDYDAVASKIELRGGAELVDGANRFKGHRLVYLVEEDRLLASSSESRDEQVSVVITPSTIEEIRDGERKDEDAPEEAGGDETVPEPDGTPPAGNGVPEQ
jgi:lipopolysaccharide transport protein LptA